MQPWGLSKTTRRPGTVVTAFGYAGLFDKYESAVRYDDLPEFEEQDRRARRVACQETLTGLEQLKRDLDSAATADTLRLQARRTQAAMQRWLAQVPDADIQAARELLAARDAADADRDGLLSEGERSQLPPRIERLWRKISPDEVSELYRHKRLGPWSAAEWHGLPPARISGPG